MLNRYPLWKYLLVLAVLIIGILYSLPNIYGKDPAVLIGAPHGQAVSAKDRDRVVQLLDEAKLPHGAVTSEDGKVQVRFAKPGDQLQASELLEAKLGNDLVIAPHLAAATPTWLRDINAKPMYLGLDLQGGIHFLMEVDMKAVLETEAERLASDIKTLLREKAIRHLGVLRDGLELNVRLRSAEERDKAREFIHQAYPTAVLSETQDGRFYILGVTLGEKEKTAARKRALEQNITTLRNRVNLLGVAEPIIQQQGEDRIVVELPGVQDPGEAKNIIGATATLEFRLVDARNDSVQSIVASGHVPPGTELFKTSDGRPVLLERRIILTGDSIERATSTIDERTGPAVLIHLDAKGGRRFDDFTKDHVGDAMAVVYSETKVHTSLVNGKKVRKTEKVQKVISVATIRSRLGSRFQIEGLDSPEEARTLALLLRAGSLAAPMEIVEERTVGPSLGQDNIDQGFNSVIIGFVLVLLFMAVYYRAFGLIANLGLTFNLVLLVAVLSMLQATLTMPGIAGIVLTVGMAVDANVLIFERIREELRAGNTPQASIHAGYEKAFSTIADANITTLIAAVVLFGLGSGPVKGFAVTLSLGILTSMFTAIMGTRAVVNLLYGARKLKKLSI
jgi:preprotein translocase subunit SecD